MTKKAMTPKTITTRAIAPMVSLIGLAAPGTFRQHSDKRRLRQKVSGLSCAKTGVGVDERDESYCADYPTRQPTGSHKALFSNHQYSSKWMFPLILACGWSAWNRALQDLDDAGRLRVDALAGVAVLRGTPIMLGLPHRKTCVRAGSSGWPSRFFQLAAGDQVLDVDLVLAWSSPRASSGPGRCSCGWRRIRLLVRRQVAEVAAVADAAGRQDPARVAAAEQLPEHVVVRRLAGAGGQEEDRVAGLDRVEREVAGDLLAHEQPVAFAQENSRGVRAGGLALSDSRTRTM